MTQTFPLADPVWCAGCGHFGVLAALQGALERLEIEQHRTMVLAGIGCSGAIQNYIEAYGYHALHGRVLPTATGVKLANPSLTVVAMGGDGDGLAIGAGHLVHAFRNNPSFAYILMNNGTYGLTKGQISPSSMPGFHDSTSEAFLDPILLGLSLPGTTFLARGSSGSPDQLARLTAAALQHAESGNGFAFLDVISPCVAYNDGYRDWLARLVDTDAEPSYDRRDRSAAFGAILDLRDEGKLPTGLLFNAGSKERPAAADRVLTQPALLDVDPSSHLDAYREVMRSFAG